MKNIKPVCLSTIFLCVFLFQPVFSSSAWDYSNEEKWPAMCREGKKQSPIDLEPEDAERKDFVPFRFQSYNQTFPVWVKNNGHTVVLDINTTPNIRPKMAGGGLYGNYNLDNLHFHWSSEHTIDDHRYPLEMHLVHYREGFRDLNEAVERGGVAVLAVLFDVSPDEDEEFKPLTDLVGKLSSGRIGDILQLYVKIEDFLPRDTAGFFRYEGSLTTPSCNEGVKWTVFTSTIPLSKNQIQTFAQIKASNNQKMEKNYRALQDLNDRPVYLKVSPIHSNSPNLMVHKELFVASLLAYLYCKLV